MFGYQYFTMIKQEYVLKSVIEQATYPVFK